MAMSRSRGGGSLSRTLRFLVMGNQLTCSLTRVLVVLLGIFPACSSAEAQETLAELIQQVRDNERLYRNLEVRFRTELSQPRVQPDDGRLPDVAASRPIGSRTQQVHLVAQQDRFYYQVRTEIADSAGKRLPSTRLSVFDGETTRELKDGRVVSSTRSRDAMAAMPVTNTFLYDSWNTPKPFSNYLTSAGNGRSTRLEWELIGRDEFQGQSCHVVEVHCSIGDNPGWYRARFYLAEAYNLFPIGVITYKPRSNDRLPFSVGSASEFRELSAGVWFPTRLSKITYDQSQLRVGKQVPSVLRSWVIESVRLDPDYPQAFFAGDHAIAEVEAP